MYAKSHIANTATKPDAAAQICKVDKYIRLTSTHIYYHYHVVIETAGTMA